MLALVRSHSPKCPAFGALAVAANATGDSPPGARNYAVTAVARTRV
jgi:hypothetical protein